jgi:septum site-determining protein MinC
MGQKLIVKGVDDKLLITILSDSWAEGLQALKEYVQANQKFLEKAKVIVDLKELELKSASLFDLRNHLNENQITLYSVYSENIETNKAAGLLGIHNRTCEKTKPISKGTGKKNYESAVIVHKTVRSGTLISEEEDVVVIGDVNPGGVVKTIGNVIIWGKLAGEVHAGIRGNKSAIICALDMNPSIMTIADCSYEANKRKSKGAEIAFIENKSVKIEDWKKITY